MTAKPRVRRAGARWRLLVHKWRGKAAGYGTAHDIRNYPNDDVIRPLGMSDEEYMVYRDKVVERRRDAGARESFTEIPGTEFDELVVGNWLHVEQLDTGYWYVHIGGVALHVKADRDGNAKRVTVAGPGDWLEPAEGCEYVLDWSRE